MRERPIIFSAPMVRAILSGAKTQTRRIIKPQPTPCIGGGINWYDKGRSFIGSPENFRSYCPYGKPGDRLWVRETWGAWPHMLGGVQRESLRYRADGEYQNEHGARRWRSPIHMPRWASRITLEITDVRVERLQDISGMDAKREGVSVPAHLPHDGADLDYARREYRRLWQSINGPGSWETNPWVWVIEFKKLVDR